MKKLLFQRANGKFMVEGIDEYRGCEWKKKDIPQDVFFQIINDRNEEIENLKTQIKTGEDK